MGGVGAPLPEGYQASFTSRMTRRWLREPTGRDSRAETACRPRSCGRSGARCMIRFTFARTA